MHEPTQKRKFSGDAVGLGGFKPGKRVGVGCIQVFLERRETAATATTPAASAAAPTISAAGGRGRQGPLRAAGGGAAAAWLPSSCSACALGKGDSAGKASGVTLLLLLLPLATTGSATGSSGGGAGCCCGSGEGGRTSAAAVAAPAPAARRSASAATRGASHGLAEGSAGAGVDEPREQVAAKSTGLLEVGGDRDAAAELALVHGDELAAQLASVDLARAGDAPSHVGHHLLPLRAG